MGTILLYSIRLVTRMAWLLGRGQLPYCTPSARSRCPSPVSPGVQGVGQGVEEGGQAEPRGI